MEQKDHDAVVFGLLTEITLLKNQLDDAQADMAAARKTIATLDERILGLDKSLASAATELARAGAAQDYLDSICQRAVSNEYRLNLDDAPDCVTKDLRNASITAIAAALPAVRSQRDCLQAKLDEALSRIDKQEAQIKKIRSRK